MHFVILLKLITARYHTSCTSRASSKCIFQEYPQCIFTLHCAMCISSGVRLLLQFCASFSRKIFTVQCVSTMVCIFTMHFNSTPCSIVYVHHFPGRSSLCNVHLQWCVSPQCISTVHLSLCTSFPG